MCGGDGKESSIGGTVSGLSTIYLPSTLEAFTKFRNTTHLFFNDMYNEYRIKSNIARDYCCILCIDMILPRVLTTILHSWYSSLPQKVLGGRSCGTLIFAAQLREREQQQERCWEEHGWFWFRYSWWQLPPTSSHRMKTLCGGQSRLVASVGGDTLGCSDGSGRQVVEALLLPGTRSHPRQPVGGL